MTDKEISVARGAPQPLGATLQEGGINFALFSLHATSVTLCLFEKDQQVPIKEISLDPKMNRTGQIWHVQISGVPTNIEYGYHVDGPHPTRKASYYDPKKLLLDPYAKSLTISNEWGKAEDWQNVRCRVDAPAEFDWEGAIHPRIPIEDLIIYEMHVRGFTKHASAGVSSPGTYRGIIEKIPYLQELGVNAIELLPIHIFNESDNPRRSPANHPLYNYWGYSTINFFAPMPRYSSGDEIREFKEMVKALHKAGIEVILDVVYNHTGEGTPEHPYFSYRGIDAGVYYLSQDYTGCGNTFNCNHPAVSQLIISSLRYWVTEMHVDGFRFDLASVLCRGNRGEVLENPPIIRAITGDPVLADVKLIAEAWDAAGLYQVGNFPGEGRWLEWNGKYRDHVRSFIKGTDDFAGRFATALSGSQDLYGHASPCNSVNFITAHDGFSLRDLVSYQDKHNDENGEENRDGMTWNDSWNCGVEGPTDDPNIQALRNRQMQNFMLALFISLGTPMLLMGDEYGHSRMGNNNTYCLDNEKNYFLWDLLKQNEGFFQFVKKLIKLRKQLPHLRRSSFLTSEEVIWYSDWDPQSRFVSYLIKDNEPLFVTFNASPDAKTIKLTEKPEGTAWKLLIDTSGTLPEMLPESFSLPSFSSFLAIAVYSKNS